MLKFSPVFRLTIGLILLTVSLLLVGDLLGLTPDPKRAELSARKAIAEALAVRISDREARVMGRRPIPDPRAYESYLRTNVAYRLGPEEIAGLREFYRPYNDELALYLGMDLDWNQAGE